MNFSLSIVILNYLNYRDTIGCVNSIWEMKYKIDKIVIVDNGSKNQSYEILKKLYQNNELIHVMNAGKNLGFAKGNNVGIEYIKKTIKSNFIMLVNNDTIFCDKRMIEIILSKYKHGVGALGPKIIGKDRKNQNPILIKNNKKQIEKQINYLNVKKFRTEKVSNHKLTVHSKLKNILKKCLYHDTILHGACLILTPDYFKYYSHLYPKTFLYYEENILKLLLNKVGLEMKYVNKTKIYHKEDQSSNLAFHNDSEIMNQYALDSAKLCLELYDKSYEEIIKEYFN